MNRTTTRLWINDLDYFAGCTGNDFYVGRITRGHVYIVMRRPAPNDPLYRKGERVRIIMPGQRKTWKGKPRRFTATVLADQRPGRPVKLLRDGTQSRECFGALYLERLNSTPFHQVLLASLPPV